MGIPGLVLGTSESINNSEMKGWAVGHMQTGIARTPDVEVKCWDYPKPFAYGKKSFSGSEFIIISSGALRLELFMNGEHQTVILNAATRDYIIIPPGVTKEVIVHEAPAWGITVRWPSEPNGNRVI